MTAMISRQRQMDRLERLARPVIEKTQQEIRQTAEQVWEQFHQNGLTHASNLSVLISFGKPQDDEPLERSWERCLASKAPELADALTEVEEFKFNPFDNPYHARAIGNVFRDLVLPKLQVRGKSDPARLLAIISQIPRWLLWVTYADFTFAALNSVSLGPGYGPLKKWAQSTPHCVLWPLLPRDALYRQDHSVDEEFEFLRRSTEM